MPLTYEKIASVTVGSGGQASMEFTSIPSNYTDLIVKLSVRCDSTTLDSHPSMLMKVNTATTNLTYRILYGTGSSALSSSGSTGYVSSINNNNTTSSTASTFSSVEVYLPNYAGATNKSYSVDSVEEHNGTTAYAVMTAGLWSQTTAINALEFYVSGNNWLQHSTATLYGISKS